MKALSEVFGLFGAQYFQKLYLNNNGITDEMMGILLEGLLENPHISSLEIVGNEVKSMGMEKLSKFFSQGRKQINVLKLSRTKTDIEQTETLFAALAEYESLRELTLQNFKITQEAASSLAAAINNNMFLQKLDIGWNTMAQPTDFLCLMEQLQDNKHLREASFTNIASTKLQGGKDGDLTIADCLTTFIRRNRSLLHLDLSYMYLGADEVLQIAEACASSRTLLSVHLTGNQVYS